MTGCLSPGGPCWAGKGVCGGVLGWGGWGHLGLKPQNLTVVRMH